MDRFINLNCYTPKKEDKFFFDTNIWIFFYCPLGKYRNDIVKSYGEFYKKILSVGSTIYISSLILSEFFNRNLRMEFDILKKREPMKYKDFKRDYKFSSKYKENIQSIAETVEFSIMKAAKSIDDGFKEITVSELLKNIGDFDFNDKYYIHLADMEKLLIVTDDADFRHTYLNVSVLTLNNRLLKNG